ncbi:MAG: metallophosphoesterase [Hyphomicrobiaceae bacterium]|nr:metallophosphoesterase [Hyphomicrobiaceae bacterium]
MTASAPNFPYCIEASGPVLVFGGPYSNLEATRAVLAEAAHLAIPPDRVICTGDIVAYCGSPVETIDLVRASGIHVLMGNCDEQVGNGADDCGCGFPAGGQCDLLSAAWFAYASARIDRLARLWLSGRPRTIELLIGDARLRVIHGSVSTINAFVFAATPRDLKRGELALAGEADGVIGGHSGLPFTEIVDGRLWHNAGVVGMPANDGTPRVWFSVLDPEPDGLRIEHRALSYDHAAAGAAMLAAGLPDPYRIALSTGIWPNCDVLPAGDACRQGQFLTEGVVKWRHQRARGRAAMREGMSEMCGVMWPEPHINPLTAAAG